MSNTTPALAPVLPPHPDAVGFYGGAFSNFVGGPIRVNASAAPYATGVLAAAKVFGRAMVCAPTVEHYFQAMKACRLEDLVYVLFAPTPGEAKRRGNGILLRAGWDRVRERVMYDAVRAKFTQYRLFHDALMDTGDRLIYENSPTDAIWGLWNAEQRDWTGLNLLGECLMRVRRELRAEALEPEEITA